jgi:hypothetical protein
MSKQVIECNSFDINKLLTRQVPCTDDGEGNGNDDILKLLGFILGIECLLLPLQGNFFAVIRNLSDLCVKGDFVAKDRSESLRQAVQTAIDSPPFGRREGEIVIHGSENLTATITTCLGLLIYCLNPLT